MCIFYVGEESGFILDCCANCIVLYDVPQNWTVIIEGLTFENIWEICVLF